jgi:beta-lactamase superfamily II metal-dependent hydrolase
MIFSLDVRRARKGDCLLLHYGTEQKPGQVMIDGGPRGNYRAYLKPRLVQIRKARGLGHDEPLHVDLLMVSHIDDDHIQGIVDLMTELVEAKRGKLPPLVQVSSLWHNSFDEIVDHKLDDLTGLIKSQFGPASLSGNGEFSEDEKSEVEDHYAGSDPDVSPEEKEELVTSTLQVLSASFWGQAKEVRVDAEVLGFPRNPEFDGNLILAGKNAMSIGQGLTFTVVGPMKPELEALRKKHREWLKKFHNQPQGLQAGFQALVAYVDRSVPNLSSLVVLAEAGGKTILLTGARGDKILQGLEAAGLMKKGGKIEVDLLKVPHHGSSNNIDDDFFQRIVARHYVFSGNGEHGNPQRKTLEKLFNARRDDDYTIHLTYPIDEIDTNRKNDWNKKQDKENKRKMKNPTQKVRPDWSPAENSLRAFFAGHEGLEVRVRIVDEKKPHLIDLLEPLGL